MFNDLILGTSLTVTNKIPYTLFGYKRIYDKFRSIISNFLSGYFVSILGMYLFMCD
jgi:hypothetical protein